MNLFLNIAIIIIVVCGILILYTISYNSFQNYIIRINEAENNLDGILRKRFDLLNKSISIIKSFDENKENILECVSKIRSKKLTNFELDRQLYEGINELQSYKEEIDGLKTNETFIKIEIDLKESEIEIEAYRKYYNNIITSYNRKVSSFPTNIVAKISKYKNFPYFEDKEDKEEISI
ncbi:MAG: LemA family protein [Bacilli bacterium]|nr:LemA family protein [Bacilli bacterium]